MNVLILDDHDIVIEGLMSLIRERFHSAELHVARSIETAREIVFSKKMDLALMDIDVPGGSVFDSISEELRTMKCRILFLSGHITDHNIHSALRMGAKAIVSKVDGVQHIKLALASILSTKVYLSPSIEKRLTLIDGKDIRSQSYENLTPREISVLRCLAKGYSTKEVAKNLFISSKTVDRHRCNIMAKLDIHSQIALSHYAIREGIIQLSGNPSSGQL